MYVVNASVHVADLRPSEPHHPEARAFLDHMRSDGEPTYSPIIVLAEVSAGISRSTGNPRDLFQRVVAILGQDT